ncbi:MAG: class I tRNA ligase family protein [Hyphomicrobium sp.]
MSRTQQMLGKDRPLCAGLGLPRPADRMEDRGAVPRPRSRTRIRCRSRNSARNAAPSPDHWITVQREEFKRLGVDGDWDNYYSTMKYSSEATIVNELGKFLMNGGLYKGSKAVLWSVVEKTALAEAEIELPRSHVGHGARALPGREVEGRQARRRLAGDLDHHALDHAGQPCARLRQGHRLRAGRG